MRYRIAALIACTIFYAGGFSQSTIAMELRHDLSFLLGKPVMQYKDKLVCRTWPGIGKPYSDTSWCQSYEIMLEPPDTVQVDDVIFPKPVIVTVDSHKMVSAVSFMKSYLTGERNDINGDFNTLVNYFNNRFNTTAKKKKAVPVNGQKMQAFEWLLPGKAITVSMTKIASRKNTRLRAVLELSIYSR
jgi:hypothetical protein